MGDVTAVEMDTVTEKSGHQVTGCAVSVCITPAAPAPLPIPYPTMGTVGEGIVDEPLRTKINGSKHATVGSCVKVCHGNEAGTLKEVVSLNTAGPSFLLMGAPTVFCELGMMGITGSLVQMNKAITVGAPGSGQGAGGGAGGGGGGGGGGGAGGPGGQSGPGGGGGGGGGSNSGAAPPSPPPPPGATGAANGGHPVDVITGAMFTNPEVDFWLTGFVEVLFSRSYRTSAVRRSCGIGWGWSHTLHYRGIEAGGAFTLVDSELRATTVVFPEGGGAVLLPFSTSIRKHEDEIVLDLGDGLSRILRRDADTSRFVLSQIRNTFGQIVELEWEKDELVGIVDSVGRRARLSRSGTTRTWTVTAADETGQEHTKTAVTYDLDARGDLVRVVDAGGFETTFEYDDEHYMTAERRPDGIVYKFEYRAVGGEKRCVETWGERADADVLALIGDADAGTPRAARGIFHARFEYGPAPFETKMIDAVGSEHRYRGNALGLVETYVDPRGYTSHYGYDELGNLQSFVDGNGRARRLGYDASGRRTSVRYADGASARRVFDPAANTTTSYDAAGTPITFSFAGSTLVGTKDSRARETLYAYNEQGRLAQVTHPNGAAETFEYDAHGNIRLRAVPYRGTWEYTFDVFGLPVRAKTARGVEFRFEYDGRGELVRITEPNDKVTEFQLTATKRVLARRDPNGAIWKFSHVDAAVIERVDPDGGTWRLGYDALLRMRWMTNPAGERYARDYDPSGNTVRETSFSGVTTEYEHDGANQIVRAVRADGTSVRLLRDGEGRIVAREHSQGVTERYEYDKGGLLVRTSNATCTVSFRRNREGRVVRETQECGGWKFVVDYEWDLFGKLANKAYSSGWGVQIKRRPEDGAMVALHATAADEEDLRFEYDPAGFESTRRRAGKPGAIATQRDAYGFPLRVSITGANDATIRERSFEWSVAGPLASAHDSVLGARRYELDPLGRPLVVDGIGVHEAFTYSSHGTAVPKSEPWSLGRNGRPAQTKAAALSWDKLGRLASRRSADPKDSWSYAYDTNDRLIEAVRGDGVRLQYLYDPLGRRVVEMRGGGESVWFGWDGDAIVDERPTNGASVQRVFAGDGITPLLEAKNGQAWRMIATDAVSAPWAYLGADLGVASVDLTTWGEVAEQRGDVGALRFAGQRADELTGLHYNRNRYYAPDLHVFLTPDPLGLQGSMQDVGYVPNTTICIDPLGLTTIINGSPGDPAIDQHVAMLQAQHPGATVLNYNQLTPGSLAGENHVIVSTHGEPGNMQWGPTWGSGTKSGYQIGSQLNAAGFHGGPGAHAELSSCNSATPQQGGGISNAQGFANATGAQTSGAASNNPAATYAGTTAAGPGGYQWGPGMMAPQHGGGTPYVHDGTWQTVNPTHSPPTPRGLGPSTLRGIGP